MNKICSGVKFTGPQGPVPGCGQRRANEVRLIRAIGAGWRARRTARFGASGDLEYNGA